MKLVLVEIILPYTCHDAADHVDSGITGAVPVKAPSPLLPNWGAASDAAYAIDMIVRFS